MTPNFHMSKFATCSFGRLLLLRAFPLNTTANLRVTYTRVYEHQKQARHTENKSSKSDIIMALLDKISARHQELVAGIMKNLGNAEVSQEDVTTCR